MNSNAVHNILNVAGVLVGTLITFDWTSLGVSAPAAATIAGVLLLGQNVIKLGINISRDGVAGLVKAQPPVEK